MRSKADIRRELIDWRKNLDAQYIERCSEAICSRLMDFDELKIGRVMCYMPFANEVNVTLLFDFLGNRLYLPVCDGERMTAVKHSGQFTRNRFGIPEPIGHFADDVMDVVITPGVAFDAQGYRVGWGQGYFDRFFAERPGVYKIGICYGGQMVSDFRPSAYDIPMDIVVTEKRVYP